MRRISFSMTEQAFLDGSKTVTRRLGWGNLRPGDVLCAVNKCMGLKKGEKARVLGFIRVVSTRREPLHAILREGPDATALEGLPELDAAGFVERFCGAMRCRPDERVTRIEFAKITEEEARASERDRAERRSPMPW